MTRPTIVIGLGGTGQYVLTFLKKELLEIGGGQIPGEVKLLAFDTASRVDPKGMANPAHFVRLGNVALEEDTEYVNIGADLYETVQRIREDQRRAERGDPPQIPHLHWFPAEELMRLGLPRAAYNTLQGAGAYRSLGRLSLFHHLYKVLGHLRQAMLALQQEVRGTRGDVRTGNARLLEIIVVASLAGGTGAGTFIDMAWLARAQADQILRDRYTLRGFFLLPTTFTPGGVGSDADAIGKQGRGFAAWRELDRAMLSSGSKDEIVYNPADRFLHIRCDVPAYDVTYLIDPARENLPIYPPPEDGIFPAVAHILSFLIDEESGKKYTENLINVLVDTRSTLPAGVYHSAIGEYTLKVPVYYSQARFSHMLAREMLRILLAPETNERGRVVRISHLENKEVDQSMSGLLAAANFLTRDSLQDAERMVPNTFLLQMIGQHRQRKAKEDAPFIKRVAEGGLRTTLQPYWNALNKITEYDPETGQVKERDFTGELQWAIWQECPPSREYGDTPEEAWTRLTSNSVAKSVPSVRARRYGIEAAAQRGARLRGEFGAELEKLKVAHLHRFKELLRMQTLQDLNGVSLDPIIARGGKLGYVRAFYQELIDSFAYFRNFLGEVRRVRGEELKLAQVTRNAADQALKIYNELKGKGCWLTFWDGNVHPDAHRAQRNWLEAEMRDIDRRRGDILLDVLDELVAEMQEYTERTLQEIESWVAHLATGDPTYNIQSLYHRVQESLDGIETNYALDKRLGNLEFFGDKKLGGVAQIITEHRFDYNREMVQQALERVRWDVEIRDDSLKIVCGVDLPGETSRFVPFRREGERASDFNLNLVLRLTDSPYQSIRRDSPLINEIVNVYPDGKTLAQALQGHAEPYYRARGGTPPPSIRQAFLRVNDANNAEMQHYFDVDFRGQFLSANPLLGGRLDKVLSEDLYKLTLVRSDDLLPSESFDQWHICMGPYQGLFRDKSPYEIHVFPAEQNAAFFEQEMPRRLKQNPRALRPEVVALLEDRQRFEMFFLAYAHQFIRRQLGEKDGVQHRFWGYQLPTHSEPIYISRPLLDGTISIFDVISNFLIGKDQRAGYDQVYRIEWDDLLNAIARREQELVTEKTIELYQAQISETDGLVNLILAEKQNVHMNINRELEKLSATIQQKYVDLADLAKTIFLMRIERLQQQRW